MPLSNVLRDAFLETMRASPWLPSVYDGGLQSKGCLEAGFHLPARISGFSFSAFNQMAKVSLHYENDSPSQNLLSRLHSICIETPSVVFGPKPGYLVLFQLNM